MSAKKPHDMGGEPGGPIDTVDHGMKFWEKQANALRNTLTRGKVLRLDELRRAAEDLGERYYELEDAKAACTEFGLDLEADRLIAVANTPEVHNVIVCTLCSCYPRALLGMPPTWYKSENYRRRVVREPRAVLREFGTVIPGHVAVRVHDSTADMRYVVVPMRPAGTEGWSEEQLEKVITRDALVGVTVPKL